MTALKAGVALSSVRRPLGGTVVCRECVGAKTGDGYVFMVAKGGRKGRPYVGGGGRREVNFGG